MGEYDTQIKLTFKRLTQENRDLDYYLLFVI